MKSSSRALLTSFFTTLFSASVLIANVAQAEPVPYSVDPAHSSVNFEIRHLFSKVRGQFTDYEGTFSYDAQKVENSSVTFKVKTDSISTNNGKRDSHLKSPDFFDAAKYPTMDFKSTKVTAAGGKNHFKVDGLLTMHGVTKPVSFDTEMLGAGKDPMGHDIASFSATGTLNRKDFGVSWNKVADSGGMMLGEDVKMEILVEAQKAGKAGAAPSGTPPTK